MAYTSGRACLLLRLITLALELGQLIKDQLGQLNFPLILLIANQGRCLIAVLLIRAIRGSTNQNKKMTTIEQTKCHWGNCNEIFENSHQLMAHYKSHPKEDENGQWSCKWVDCQKSTYSFAERARLLTHMRVHCRELIKCDCGCGIFFQTRRQYEKHLLPAKFTCQVEGCSKSFRTSSGRAKHEKTHTPTDHHCPSCDYICKTRSTLVNHHLRKHHSKLPLKYKTEVARERTKIVPIEIEPTKGPIWMYYDQNDQVVPEIEETKNYANNQNEELEYETYTENYQTLFFTPDEILNCKL